MSLVYLLIAILVIMAMILLMSKRRALAKYAGYIALVAPVISSIYFLIQIPSVAKLQYLSTSIPWIKTLDINLDLRLDGLSLMFSLIISLIGIAVFFYATQYLSSRKD
ncbi:TPA: cation:proton antiporter, partial [Staphylococcus aureus]|nr:cation:proton antiporter [Staphylococcus aureus]HBP3413268.1 cation:proton antiporter [Staphylococcus aureus]